ncbi:MAG: aminotransferase class V-fold PLP-dependent enzyme [Thermoactinomyces sp.]
MYNTIYLDNAATTWPKPETVYQAVETTMRELGANPGRSSHRMSLEAEKIIEQARQSVKYFFNAASPQRVIFTLNCTDSLNIAIKGLIKRGMKVVTSPYEHNSVRRPLLSLQKEGVTVVTAHGTDKYQIDLDHFRELCSNGIDFAVLSHVSNVTGSVQPVAEIADIVHEQGGKLILDAAQSAGILDINLQETGIDILAVSGHKGLYGPMGVGILVLAEDFPVRHFREGGSGAYSEVDYHPEVYPWRLEGGTPNLPGISGLAAGISFVRSAGVDAMGRHVADLAEMAISGLREIEGVRLYCGPEAPKTGVVSFTLERMDVALAASVLDQAYQIAVRGGLHCAPITHQELGTFPGGTLRASFGHFNNFVQVEQLIEAVREMSRV